MPKSQSQSQLQDAFKKSPQLLKFYHKGQLDAVIAQFPSIIDPQFYLGGHKCSAFRIPDQNLVFKLSLRNIRYFKNRYCDKFRNFCAKPTDLLPQDPLFFFQYHINSMPSCYAPIQDILYQDDNVFVYTQELCTPVREYQTVKGETVFDPIIIVKILQLIINLFRKNNLVTEIGTYNIGILESGDRPRLVLFDYETIRPFKETVTKRPMTWWGSLIGDLLHYLSHVFCPERQQWYHKNRKYWRKHPKDLNSIAPDFPPYIIDLIDSLIHPMNDVDEQISTIIRNLNYCRKQIIAQIQGTSL